VPANLSRQERDRARDLHGRVTAGHLRIAPVRPSWSARLGPYYLDLRDAIPLVESEYHGPLDPHGVPLTRTGHAEEAVYNAITIAQYALALHDEVLRTNSTELRAKLVAQVEAILNGRQATGARRGFIVHGWDNRKYPELRAPWVSALTQGNAISALLRAHQLIGGDHLLRGAAEMFEALSLSIEQGGVLARDACGHLWFEEYPTRPFTHVLNGFVFALWGVLDYARATSDDRAWQWWREGTETLLAHVPDFDAGYWSVYDLRYRELVSLHYQVNVHVPQMESLYHQTGHPVFRHYAERWKRFGGSRLSRSRMWVGQRWQAVKRGRRFA
jgi:hypothetical protein